MREFPQLKGEEARAFRLYNKYLKLVEQMQAAKPEDLPGSFARTARAAQGAEIPELGPTALRLMERQGLVVVGRGDRDDRRGHRNGGGEGRFLRLLQALEQGEDG